MKGLSMRKLLLVPIVLVLAVPAVRAQKIRSVSLVGAWGGLGTPAKSELQLSPSGDEFKGGGITISKDAVQRLLVALREPALPKPSAENLGVDEAWLRTHAEAAGNNASGIWFNEGTPAQKQFFISKFLDKSTLQSRLEKVYAGFHTDDYPVMHIVIEFADGSSLHAGSYSQHPLMLPWCVGEEKDCENTFNAHISEALFAVLPKKFTDRERLVDANTSEDLAAEMGLYMAGDLEGEWNRIGVQDKDPTALNELKKHFTVRYVDINTWNDFYFNEVPNTGKKVDENLQVLLWRPGLPEKFTIAAHLLREKGVTEGLAELPARANSYADEVLSVEWLRKFLFDHPKEQAFVVYVHGVSMTDKALRIFDSDMKATGHRELIDRVRAVQNDAALLETGSGDWWIVLPDHSMILWRWKSLHPILKWPKNTFPEKECSDYGMVTGGCDGTVISPSGEIVH